MKNFFTNSYAPCNTPVVSPSEEVSPLITYQPATVDLVTLRANILDQADESDDIFSRSDATCTRAHYVGSSSLDALRQKLSSGREISKDEVLRLLVTERLPDHEMVVPVDMGVGADQRVEELLRRHGPRGAAQSILAARDRAEAALAGEAITVREMREMAGEADTTLKPLLLGLVLFTGLAAIALSAAKEGSRQFLAASACHLLPEAFLWSYLVFGPGPQGADRRRPARLAVRALLLAGALLAVLAPGTPMGPWAACAYCVVAQLSECICLWLGLFYYFYRLDVGIRRLGAGLFIHGFAFQLAVAEFVNPELFQQDGTPGLSHWAWFMLLFATCCEFVVVTPILKIRHINVRAQQPAAMSAGLILAFAAASALGVPLLAGGRWRGSWRSGLLAAGPLLPSGHLLLASRALASASAVALMVYALNEYALGMPRPGGATLGEALGEWVASLWPGSRQIDRWLPAKEDVRCTWCKGEAAVAKVEEETEVPAMVI